MKARRKKYRLAIAALLATVVAAPTAYAMPAEPSTAQKHAVVHQDLRAEGSIPGSRVEAAAQDLRAEGSIPGSRVEAAAQDLRAEGSIPGSRVEAAAQDLRAEGSIPGSRVEAATQDPRWEDSIVPSSRNELPIAAAAPQPVPGDGDDIEWPYVVLALSGALTLGGGLAMAAQRLRAQSNPAH